MKEKTFFEIIHNMDKVTNHLIIQWNQTFNEDLGISHILVLSHLRTNGKSRPSDIAKALGMKPPSVTHLSDKLVKKDLVVRITDEWDRRIIYLGITEAGQEIIRKANHEGALLRKNLFEKLTEEEQQQLLRIYEKLSVVE